MKKKIDKLIQYIELLDEWNEKFNLVSYKTIDELLINHIIDSLSIMELLNFKDQKIGDVGTGAGLPGIVLSILLPSNQYVLIEPKKKYYQFLKKVISKLKLNNINLINNKIEEIDDLDTYNMILSRAVGSLNNLCSLKSINRSNLLIFYKGIKVFNELSTFNFKDFKIIFIKKIKLLEKYNQNHYIIALIKKD